MLRQMCVLVALTAMLLTSGCCFRRCSCRPLLRNRDCCAPACCPPVTCCHPDGFVGPPAPVSLAPPLAPPSPR